MSGWALAGALVGAWSFGFLLGARWIAWSLKESIKRGNAAVRLGDHRFGR